MHFLFNFEPPNYIQNNVLNNILIKSFKNKCILGKQNYVIKYFIDY
jgi:hypothetical protein